MEHTRALDASDSPSAHHLARKRKISDVRDVPPLPHTERSAPARSSSSASAYNEFEWETSKENVMPLKRGRNVPELNRALRAQDSFQDKLRLEQHAKQLEAEIDAYEGDDPLGLWLQYIRWIEAKMPEDTRKRFSVLEKCTRALKEHARYTNDLRYIRVWIQYADLVSNPKDIFKYLYQNKIGEHVSLFYVGWAWVLESMANYAQANKVYLKATQKNAEPQDLLTRKYKEFQRRMSRHWLKVNEANDVAQEVNQRAALESMSAHTAEFAGVVDANERQQQAFARAQHTQQANAHKPNKENEVAAAKWNQPMTRSSAHSDAPERAAGAESASAEPLQRIEGVATEEELLAKKPLKNFALGHDKPRDSAVSKPTQTSKTSKPSLKSEKIGYDLEQLRTTTGGELLSFEEARARAYTARARRRTHATSKASAAPAAAPVPAPALQNRFLVAPASSQAPMNSFLDTNAAASTSIGYDQISRRLSFATTTKKLSPRRSGIPAAQLASLDQAAQEDVTINTRVAMSEVNDMFCSPDREGEGKVWDIRDEDPVERKLHFSVFDDSVESVAASTHEQLVSEDAPVVDKQQAFSIFADDDAPAAPPTDSKAKALPRKPLGSREDLLRSVRLTNKDVLMQLRDDKTDDANDKSGVTTVTATKEARAPKKARCAIARTVVTPDAPTRRQAATVPTQPATPQKRATILAKPLLPVECESTAALSLDPYRAEHRRRMIQSECVSAYLADRPDVVHFHARKLPLLPCQDPQRRKLKKPIALELSPSFAVEVTSHLGSGAFAHVFAATATQPPEMASSMALKYEKHRSNLPWEFYVTNKIAAQLLTSDSGLPAPPIAIFHRLDIFRDGCMLFMQKSAAGTLHDLLNCYKKIGKPFPEPVAVHYTIQMLRAVELLHAADILHGDVKPDNWLVVPGTSASALDSPRKPEAAASCAYQTGDLALIDFGRAIDLSCFPAGTTFAGDCHTKGFQTTEMLSRRPWTKQIDTFGICATAHCMLFGDYMEVASRSDSVGNRRWIARRPFKRYWSVAIWTELFDALLNVKSCVEQPSLSRLRRKLESFFAHSPQRVQLYESHAGAPLLLFRFARLDRKTRDASLSVRDLQRWDFDSRTIAVPADQIAHLGAMFEYLDAPSLLGISSYECTALLIDIQDGYSHDATDLPFTRHFHNFRHAFDVAQTLFAMFAFDARVELLTALEKVVLVIAAVGHDIWHPGVTNRFLVATQHPLALTYGYTSVLENMHAAKTMALVERHNVLRHLTSNQKILAQHLLVSSILGTDVAQHDRLLLGVRDMVAAEQTTPLSSRRGIHNRVRISSFLLHCADISNAAKPFHIAAQWTDLIMKEFFEQGEAEKRLGLPVSLNCDANATSVPELQIQFIQSAILPTFTLLECLLPGAHVAVHHTRANLCAWERKRVHGSDSVQCSAAAVSTGEDDAAGDGTDDGDDVRRSLNASAYYWQTTAVTMLRYVGWAFATLCADFVVHDCPLSASSSEPRASVVMPTCIVVAVALRVLLAVDAQSCRQS